ncbi:MAG: hypothetical protein JXN61_01850, partial [Sedimentisphaerales bacterium]|nr:hypothetical protein [Sedimentisphaerales bacterium]
TGSVSADDHAGGLVGSNDWYGSISRAYFLHSDDGGGPNNGCGIPLTDIQMRQQGSFVGWDFVGESVDGTSEIWQMPVGVGYPILSSFNGYAPPVLAGDGTADSPYLISGPNELGTMYHYDPSASYRVTADIDLSGITWSVSPIPTFFGTFDGNDHVIRNLDVNVPDGDDVGVFGYVGFGADIRSIGIEDASIAGRRFVGALAGYNDAGSVSSCYATGSISGEDRDVGGLVGYNYDGNISNCCATCSVGGEDGEVGGLVGWNHGSITTCYATGAVSGNGDQIGGLVGWNKEGTITNCYGIGPVSGDGYVGGLAGLNSAGTSGSSAVTNCFATGPVRGDDHVGGLVGENYGSSIANSYATGSVTGDRRVGGLAGYNANYASIKDSYSTGSVDGNDSVGGLVGSNSCSGLGNSTITNCYTIGSVSGDSSVGGLVGSNCSGIISRAYFLHPDDGGGADNGFGEPLTDIQTQQRGSFTGWDFVGPGDGSEDIWSICEGTNYPRLVWQIPAADWLCPDGVGLEDFGHLGAYWGTDEVGAVNLDGNDGIGFGDLMIFCQEWLRSR